MCTPPPGQPTFTIAGEDIPGLVTAINAANAAPDPDIINLSDGVYTLTSIDNTTDGSNGLPVITTPITIHGGACATLTREASAPEFRLFRVAAGGSLTLSDLTVTNGNSGEGFSGGIISNSGTLTLHHVTLSGGYADVNGGAVYNDGTLTIEGSTLSDNQANQQGGALYNNAALTVTNSILSGSYAGDSGAWLDKNSADGAGGGVYNAGAAGSAVHDSCITQNTASDGGGVYSSTPAFDATGNWWNAADGPSGAGPGSGDAVNANVVFNPFLTEGCPLQGGMALAAGGEAVAGMPLASGPVFSDAFDAGAGWMPTGAWALDTQTAHNGAAWAVDTTRRGQVSLLEYGAAIDLRGVARPQLTFWQRGQLSNVDVVAVEVLPEGASAWVLVDVQTGPTGEWTQRVVNLACFGGQAIHLRFRLNAVAPLTGDQTSTGYGIDNLVIQDAAGVEASQ